MKNFLDAPYDWVSNPLNALYLSPEETERLDAMGKNSFVKIKADVDASLTRAKAAETVATQALFVSAELNNAAKASISEWLQLVEKASKAKKKAEIKPYNRIFPLVISWLVLSLVFSIGNKVMGRSVTKSLIGFPGIFVAWFVTPIVLVVTYWFGQNILKIPSKTLKITVSADIMKTESQHGVGLVHQILNLL